MSLEDGEEHVNDMCSERGCYLAITSVHEFKLELAAVLKRAHVDLLIQLLRASMGSRSE